MIQLHLGCGKRDFGSDWIHIDGTHEYEHIKYHDIIQLPYYNEVDLIYASHVLEYFDREEAEFVLRQWHRALKPGGILRLAVPDFEAMAKLYVEGKFPLDSFLGPLYGRMLMDDKIIYHKTVYDKWGLKDLLRSVGFEGVRFWDWKYTDHREIDDQSRAYLPKMDFENGTLISLNLEAHKFKLAVLYEEEK